MARTPPPARREGRRPLIAGNWKMHMTHLEAIGLTQKVVFSLTEKDLDVVEDLLRDGERELLHQADRVQVRQVHLPVAGDERPTPRVGRPPVLARHVAPPLSRRAP